MPMHDTRNIAVEAQVDWETGRSCAVIVSSLTSHACELADSLPVWPGNLTLWLGAIGPLRAHLEGAGGTMLVFDGPIHPAIADHFNAG